MKCERFFRNDIKPGRGAGSNFAFFELVCFDKVKSASVGIIVFVNMMMVLFVSANVLSNDSLCRGKLTSKDVFLTTPPAQPKKTIAKYLAEFGIKTPKQFETIEEAIESGKGFILRSESAYEYSGAAGLAESYRYTPEEVDAAVVFSQTFKTTKSFVEGDVLYRNLNADSIGLVAPKIAALAIYINSKDINLLSRALRQSSLNNITRYAKLNGISPEVLMDSFSFSIWEYIDGVNHAIVADSSVPNRYHLFSSRTDCKKPHWSYVIIQDDTVLREGPSVDNFFFKHTQKFSEEFYGTPSLIVSFYEKIRQSQGFDGNHSPIVEYQSVAPGDYYFLQYHRTRDTVPRSFHADGGRLLSEGYFKSDFVRGATPPEGYLVDVEINDQTLMEKGLPLVSLEVNNIGAYELHDDRVYREFKSRHVLVSFQMRDFDSIAAYAGSSSHVLLSEIFNPPVALSFDIRAPGILPEELNLNHMARIRAHVVSDGENAYVKVQSFSNEEAPGFD